MLLYIAGSSKELDRVEQAMDAAMEAGFGITYRWVDEIRAAGRANDLPHDEAQEASAKCLEGIMRADLVVYIVPSRHVSAGAMFEVGYAVARLKPVVTIGHEPSIFASLTAQADGDLAACFATIRNIAVSGRPPSAEYN